MPHGGLVLGGGHDRARRGAARARGVLPERRPALRRRNRAAERSGRHPEDHGPPPARPEDGRWSPTGGTPSRTPSASRADPRGRVVAFTDPVRAGRRAAAPAHARPAVRAVAPAPARASRPARPAGPARPLRARARHRRRALAVLRRAAARHRARLARGGPGAAAHLLRRRAERRCSASSGRSASSRSRTAATSSSAASAFRPIVCDLGPGVGRPAGCPGSPRATCPSRPPSSTRTRASSCLDGRRVALTKLECDVLRYLRDREDQPVAREALLRDVWGYEWTGGSNVVDVAVSGLRRKLGDRAARAGDRARRRLPPAPALARPLATLASVSYSASAGARSGEQIRPGRGPGALLRDLRRPLRSRRSC